MKVRGLLATLLVIVTLSACAPAARLGSQTGHSCWAAAWTSAPSPFLPGGHGAYLEPYTDLTVRQPVRLDAGGTAVRVRFTNELGRDPLRIGAASLGRMSADGRTVESIAPLTFGGESTVRIPPGAAMLSDPLPMSLARFDDVAVSAYFSEPTRPTGHRHRLELSPGDSTRLPAWPAQEHVRGATVVSALQTCGTTPRRVLVAFGDSITEGAGATPEAHMSWPAQLARSIARRELPFDWTVVNAGISGNRLLHNGGSQNGLARFARDALSVAGVTDVIVLEGINDLGVAYSPVEPRDIVDAEDLILAYRQMIERAHVRGVRIYGATLLPFKGAVYFSSAGEAARRKVNAWIRDSGAFDGVIDLDAVMRDPDDPARLRPDFEIGDSLHPNDAGYAAMAQAVDAFLLQEVGRP